MRRSAVLVLMSLFVFGMMSWARADVLSATDGGWTISYDTLRQTEPGDDTPMEGLIRWEDTFGRNHIWEGSWWSRRNDLWPESPFSSAIFESASNPSPNQILLNYTIGAEIASLDVRLQYTLTGSGLSSAISESMVILNPYNFPQHVSLFEYNDFDLTGSDDNDGAFGNIFAINQYDNWSRVSVVPVSSIPGNFQITTFSLLVDSLSDGSPTNLDGSGSPYGPGDATFAFQWDLALSSGETYIIDKTMTLTTTPEPMSSTLFFLGGGAMALVRRKRRGQM